MCGLTGLWSMPGELTQDETVSMLARMNAELARRGPDGEGAWSNAAEGIALAHRRLAILDLSDAGKQPMFSASGRYVITYNGELYNYRELGTELAGLGYSFRGHSDTEILLAALEEWGVERSLARFNGMFAFAVWDSHERTLWLARDRIGKKPLYFAIVGRTLLFGSQIRSLMASGRLDRRVDSAGVAELFRYGFIAAPRTILQGVAKLRAGCAMQIGRSPSGALQVRETRFWRPPAMHAGERELASYDMAKERLRSLLRDAVNVRMVADVPLGAFLSGGIDSSLVTGVMQECASRPIKTFTIGFEHADFNEAEHAAAVARHLGTDHTETRFSQQDLLDLVPALPAAFDEPFGDSSQLPTLLLSKLTRQHVTVALSGDGGDELFGGYRRYQRFHEVWHWYSRLGPQGRRCAIPLLRAGSRVASAANIPFLEGLAQRAPGAVKLSQQLDKVADFLGESTRVSVYERLMSSGERPESFIGGLGSLWRPDWVSAADDGAGEFEWMMLIDEGWYLPEDILVKVDRASMFVSLEARAPLLDYRIVELAASMPEAFKVRAGGGKRILTDLAYEYVPRELLERPKQGFGAPIADWLRGPLREWAEDLLSPASLARTGILDGAEIRKRWVHHCANTQDYSFFLWQVLMFKAWHEQYMERSFVAAAERARAEGPRMSEAGA